MQKKQRNAKAKPHITAKKQTVKTLKKTFEIIYSQVFSSRGHILFVFRGNNFEKKNQLHRLYCC